MCSLSLSLSLSHTHKHTHTHLFYLDEFACFYQIYQMLSFLFVQVNYEQ